MQNVLHIPAKVQQAIQDGGAVVALESTVITHGLPYPENLKVTLDMIKAVEDQGATPAVIAIFNGQIIIGLNSEQIMELARSRDAEKCSLRDLPVVCAKRNHGSTTVAATMHLATQAGISVFATGGIGGVHRDASHDVSADLTALGHYNMMVVCSGAKSILDLPATREELETRGILVAGWKTDQFPAFYARESGLQTDAQVDTAVEAAILLQTMRELELRSAMLLTVPVPQEKAMLESEIQPVIEHALQDAMAAGVKGKEITPFLLNAIRIASGDKSMAANTALLVQNASIAGQVALALSQKPSSSLG